jgi:hypothetical protein
VESVCEVAGGKGSTGSEEERKRVFRHWTDAAQVNLGQPDDGQYSEASSSFWRTMLGGIMSEGSEAIENSDWQRFNNQAMAWIEEFSSWVHDGREDVGFALSRTLLVATYSRYYFRAQGGGQGLCHPTVEAGDEVWVVDGSKVPFILRRAHLIIDEGKELRPQNAYGVDEDGHFGLESDFQPEDGPYVHYYLVCDCSKTSTDFMDGEAVSDNQQSIVLV